jgi:hypothetical protein
LSARGEADHDAGRITLARLRDEASARRMFRVATCEVVGGNAVHVVWRRDRAAG